MAIPTKNVTRSTNKTQTSILRRLTPKKLGLVSILAFALIGVIFMVFSKAADPSTVSANIIKTNFTYPSNAVFVSPNGNDSAAGTKDAPLGTLGAAVSKAAGGTVVMRGGVYRQPQVSIYRAVTIQPYPNEEVWLDGSDEVTGWVQDGGAWRKDSWTAGATVCPNGTCYDAIYVSDQNKAAGLPDMVFADNVAQRQLTDDQVTTNGIFDTSKVTAGTFYVRRGTNQLYIGTNPSVKKIESATRKQAIQYYGASTAGSKLRGIGIRRYASNLTFSSKPAEVEVSNGALGIEFDSVVFTQSATNGLFVGGPSTKPASGVVIKNSVFASNGAAGAVGNYVDGAVVDNNIFYANNTEKAQYEGPNGTFAGAKFTYATNSTFSDNLFQDNYGTGLWCDLACRGSKIVGNMARGNLVNGLYYEVGYDGMFASNVTYNNGGSGIKASGQGMKIYNNTSYNNAGYGIFAYDDPDTTRIASSNIEIKNNIVAGGTRTSTNPLIYVWAGRGSLAQKVTAMDYNLYLRPSTTQPRTVLSWADLNVNYQYASLNSTLQSQTGREAHGKSQDGNVAGVLMNADSGDFKLVSGSLAVAAGDALPADVASTLGVATTTKVNIGALSWRAGSSNAMATSTPDPVIPPAPAPNQMPTVQLQLSGTAFTEKSNANFTVKAAAADADGSITKLEILQNDAAVATCLNATACSYSASNYVAGEYRFSARATDNATSPGVTTSSVQKVVVAPPATTPPPPTPPVSVPNLLAPTSLNVISGVRFDNYLPISWSPVVGATSYVVTRTGQSPKTVTTNTYSEVVSPGYTYSYQVKAINGSAESPQSSPLKAQVSCFLWFCGPSVVN